MADDITTLDSLAHYLRPRVSFRAVARLDGAFTSLAASDAVIFYPDGFPARAVSLFVRRLAGNATLSVVIIVTVRPELFRALGQGRSTANRFIVLPKPAWPWELFATMQASLPCFRREDICTC